jgi:hypothetical protein
MYMLISHIIVSDVIENQIDGIVGNVEIVDDIHIERNPDGSDALVIDTPVEIPIEIPATDTLITDIPSNELSSDESNTDILGGTDSMAAGVADEHGDNETPDVRAESPNDIISNISQDDIGEVLVSQDKGSVDDLDLKHEVENVSQGVIDDEQVEDITSPIVVEKAVVGDVAKYPDEDIPVDSAVIFDDKVDDVYDIDLVNQLRINSANDPAMETIDSIIGEETITDSPVEADEAVAEVHVTDLVDKIESANDSAIDSIIGEGIIKDSPVVVDGAVFEVHDTDLVDENESAIDPVVETVDSVIENVTIKDSRVVVDEAVAEVHDTDLADESAIDPVVETIESVIGAATIKDSPVDGDNNIDELLEQDSDVNIGNIEVVNDIHIESIPDDSIGTDSMAAGLADEHGDNGIADIGAESLNVVETVISHDGIIDEVSVSQDEGTVVETRIDNKVSNIDMNAMEIGVENVEVESDIHIESKSDGIIRSHSLSSTEVQDLDADGVAETGAAQIITNDYSRLVTDPAVTHETSVTVSEVDPPHHVDGNIITEESSIDFFAKTLASEVVKGILDLSQYPLSIDFIPLSTNTPDTIADERQLAVINKLDEENSIISNDISTIVKSLSQEYSKPSNDDKNITSPSLHHHRFESFRKNTH